MAIANGTCVSFCNHPKAQFGYLRRVTPVCRCLHPFCGWRHLATSRESKAHFGLPWVRPWDNRGKCYRPMKRPKEDSMLVKRYASQHVPIYLQPFPSNSTRKFKIYSTSKFSSIYLQPFTSYSEILVGNCNFSYPLAFNAPVRVFSLEFREKVWSSEN